MTSSTSELSNLVTSFNASANTYERRVGTVTRAVTTHIISLLKPLPSHPVVLDNACGTGAFTGEFLKACPDAKIYAVDGSPGMIGIMQFTVQDRKWSETVYPAVMDGQSLDFPDNNFDISITNFGIFFFPDPSKGARETHRTLKIGGVAAVTCWKHIGFQTIFYEVQKSIQPISPVSGSPLEEWQPREKLEMTMIQAGFANVKMENREVVYWAEGLADLVGRLVENFKSIIGPKWTEGEKSKLEKATENIIKENRETHCVEGEGNDAGKVGVKMDAWIAIGRKEGM